MIYVFAAIIVLVVSFVIALITLANESKKEKEVVSKELVIPQNGTDTQPSDLDGKTKDEAVARLEQVIARESEKESYETPGINETRENKIGGEAASERSETRQMPKEPFPWEVESGNSDPGSSNANETSTEAVFDPPINSTGGGQANEHVISIADLVRQQGEDV